MSASAVVSARASPYRPRRSKYETVAEARDVTRSGAASVGLAAGLFILGLFAILDFCYSSSLFSLPRKRFRRT